MIKHTINRVGILDRKLRIVNENTETKDEWINWATEAVKSTYGYEYQGDSLLLARINVLLTFVEYYERRFDEDVEKRVLNKLANIISWNLWQMDGLTDTVPFKAQDSEDNQISIFDILDIEEKEEEKEPVFCRIYDWKTNRSQAFKSLKENI